MTRDETWKIVYVIKSSYPKHYERFSERDFDNLCTSLHMCLEDYSYQQVSMGLKAFLVSDTKGFPPVAGQIIEQIHKLTPSENQLGSLEAWNKVMTAIRNGVYGSEKEFAKLPPLIQKTIGSPQYLYDEATNSDFNMDVAKGQFIKNYEITVKREIEDSKLRPIQIELQERLRLEG